MFPLTRAASPLLARPLLLIALSLCLAQLTRVVLADRCRAKQLPSKILGLGAELFSLGPAPIRLASSFILDICFSLQQLHANRRGRLRKLVPQFSDLIGEPGDVLAQLGNDSLLQLQFLLQRILRTLRISKLAIPRELQVANSRFGIIQRIPEFMNLPGQLAIFSSCNNALFPCASSRSAIQFDKRWRSFAGSGIQLPWDLAKHCFTIHLDVPSLGATES
jgi:hypothetical protein